MKFLNYPKEYFEAPIESAENTDYFQKYLQELPLSESMKKNAAELNKIISYVSTMESLEGTSIILNNRLQPNYCKFGKVNVNTIPTNLLEIFFNKTSEAGSFEVKEKFQTVIRDDRLVKVKRKEFHFNENNLPKLSDAYNIRNHTSKNGIKKKSYYNKICFVSCAESKRCWVRYNQKSCTYSNKYQKWVPDA